MLHPHNEHARTASQIVRREHLRIFADVEKPTGCTDEIIAHALLQGRGIVPASRKWSAENI
jgi:hypothetical protein